MLLVAYGAAVLDDKSRRRNTAEAPAEIVDVRLERDSRGPREEQRDERHVRYRYRNGGRWIADRNIVPLSERWSVGEPVKVCYDPTTPRAHRLERADYRCGT